MAKAKAVSLEPTAENTGINPQRISAKHVNRLKVFGAVLTLAGIALFSYFVFSVGLAAIVKHIEKFGVAGFAVILLLYFVRIALRAGAWKLSVYEPYSLSVRDTIPAVIIGEALSTMLPLGILVSGTSKAVAVRDRVPIVVGLSSVATENLFYSFTTSIFLVLGAYTFLRCFQLDDSLAASIDVLIVVLLVLLVLGLVMVIRQWHFASEICEWLYGKNIGRRWLEHTRSEVRLFENLIYGFYRRYPRRFLPICLLETAFHLLGVVEVWFILNRISENASMLNAFLLESVSRLITILFKLVPFLIGVDEAGAQYVAKTIAAGVGIGVTIAIIRKGRILFWTAIGLILIIKRGMTLRQISKAAEQPA